jgi:hypothetical protein
MVPAIGFRISESAVHRIAGRRQSAPRAPGNTSSMDAFTVIIFGFIGILVLWAVIVGVLSPRRSTAIITRPGRRKPGQDAVATPRQALRDDTTVRDTLAAENARRRREGRPELSEREMEERVAADAAARRRAGLIEAENLRRIRGGRPRLTHREAGRLVDERERAKQRELS